LTDVNEDLPRVNVMLSPVNVCLTNDTTCEEGGFDMGKKKKDKKGKKKKK